VGMHFSALGFAIDTSAQLEKLVRNVLSDSETVQRDDGGMTCVRGTGSRAAVAVHVDEQGEVFCVAPFFSPSVRQRVRYCGLLSNPDCAQCAPVLVRLDTEIRKDVPLAFVTPHAVAWRDALVAGDEIEVGFGAVAEKMEVRELPPEKNEHGIVAYGLEESPQQPFVRLTGIVQTHFQRRNELDGAFFEWALLDVEGVRIEVVMDPDMMENLSIEGLTVSGDFRLTGPIWRYLDSSSSVT